MWGCSSFGRLKCKRKRQREGRDKKGGKRKQEEEEEREEEEEEEEQQQQQQETQDDDEEEKTQLVSAAIAADGCCIDRHAGRFSKSKAILKDLASLLRSQVVSALRRISSARMLPGPPLHPRSQWGSASPPSLIACQRKSCRDLKREGPELWGMVNGRDAEGPQEAAVAAAEEEGRGEKASVYRIPPAALRAYRQFTLRELNKATSNFCDGNILGKGSSGSVYRGKLPSGLAIAVKAFNPRLKDSQLSFITEIEMMCYIRDLHIQPLIGFCIQNGQLLLVYDYMPQGSLEAWLHGKNKPALSWRARERVALGITKALHYLHTVCKPPIIHRDVKASNILLSDGKNPKLSDFGLAVWALPSFSVSQEIMGTFGYLAPEYFQMGKISTKIDIYSLGVVLLELVTGRKPIEQENFSSWVKHLIDDSDYCMEEVVDPRLKGLYSRRGMRRMLAISALCVHPVDTKRPSIGKVLSLMQKEPGLNMDQLLLEAYGNPLALMLDCSRDSSASTEDERRKHLEMAMIDVDE